LARYALRLSSTDSRVAVLAALKKCERKVLESYAVTS
jgi:hypothetical protein